MKRTLVILLGSMLAASVTFATTYVRVEKDGSKTYSDRPLPGGKPVDLEPAQTYSNPPSATGSSSGNVPREQQLLREMDNFRYTSCTLTPKNDETFTNPESVAVSLLLNPPLRAGDVVQVLVDGAPMGGGLSIFSFVIPQPFRGAHAVTASVKDRYGRTLCSASSTFHVFRPSINSPARRQSP